MHPLALISSAIGLMLTTAGTIIASTHPADITPWLTGSGSAFAVGGLIYIAKKLSGGELVHTDVYKTLSRSEQRENILSELVKQGHQREADFRDLLLGKMQGFRSE